jgi:hypothetical protein
MNKGIIFFLLVLVMTSNVYSIEESCIDLCGDGVCQQENCSGREGCPCYETARSCRKDCSGVQNNVVSSIGGFNLGMPFWVGLSVLGALLFIFLGFKILKWLFWTLALLMLVLAIVFWFVL